MSKYYLDIIIIIIIMYIYHALINALSAHMIHTPCEVSSASDLLCMCGVNVNLLKYALRKMSKSNNTLKKVLRKSIFISNKYFFPHCDQTHNIYLINSFAIQSDAFEKSLWNTYYNQATLSFWLCNVR